MKTILLFAAAFATFSPAATAFETSRPKNAENYVLFNFDQPITFTERGIEFFIFPNGEFDFNTVHSTGSDYYRPGTRGNGYSTNFQNTGVRIEHDAAGRVRRIGNIFVNYDNNSRVKRIGNVYMSYYRSALTQVGGLRLIYDRRGRLVDMVGSVKHNSQSFAYNGNHNFYSGAQNGTINENEYYYYKTDGTKAKLEDDNAGIRN